MLKAKRADLYDSVPGLLCSETSHLGKLVEGLDADSAVCISSVLNKGPHAVSAHLSHPLVQFHILQNSLQTIQVWVQFCTLQKSREQMLTLPSALL